MKEADGLLVGWVESSVNSLVRGNAALFRDFGCVLVTSLDSTTNLREMRDAVATVRHHPECRFLGEGLVIPGRLVPELTTGDGLFTGFDELWCFAEEPTAPKPPNVSLVAPLNLEDEDVDSGLLAWMKASRCTLGVGDGIGLNYATPDPETATLIEQTVGKSH